MDDVKIVELYWERDQKAIVETDAKYGRYCFSIAENIVLNRDDAAECLNDTYLGAWNAMPPHRPSFLGAFVGKLTRRIAIDRRRRALAGKRGGGEFELALDELEECVSGDSSPEDAVVSGETVRSFNEFLDGLTKTERSVFLRRYWYSDGVDEIAERFGFSPSKVSSMLFRTRKKLRKHLEKEGLL